MGLLAFALAGVLFLALSATLVVALVPAAFFLPREPSWRRDGLRPAAGLLLLASGLVIGPAAPAVGALAMLLGALLLLLGGDHRAERSFLERSGLYQPINRLRCRLHRPPLELRDR